MSAMPAAPPRARWPWVVLALALAIALIGFALVPINGESVLGNTTNFIAFMGMGVVGALSLSRSPTNRVGFLLLWIAITIGTAFAAGEASTYLEARGDETAASWLAWAGAVVGVVAFVAGCFAEPRFTLGEGGPPEITITNPLHVPALEAFTGVGGLLWPFLAGLFVLAAVSAILRFRRSSGVERQQLKWFAFAGGLMAAYLLISIALEVMRIDTGSIDQIISGVVYLGIPTAVGIAILQYRLWDLDVVVKKTVVAGTLVVFALVVYGAAVVLIPTLVDMDNPVFLFALALALGLAFRPAIGVARRLADRLVYGKRATPYEVLTEFSERMGDAYATEDVLPRMAQVLGQGTGAEVARVWLLSGRELRQSAAWPAESVMLDPVALADEDGWAPPGETAG